MEELETHNVPSFENTDSKVWAPLVPGTRNPRFQDWEALVSKFGNYRFLNWEPVVPRLGGIGSKFWEPAVIQSGNPWFQGLGTSSCSKWEPVVPKIRNHWWHIWEALVPGTKNPWAQDWKELLPTFGKPWFQGWVTFLQTSDQKQKLFKFVCFADHQAKQQKRTQKMFVESDAYVWTFSNVIFEIKNAKPVVSRLAGIDANVWSKAKCYGNGFLADH